MQGPRRTLRGGQSLFGCLKYLLQNHLQCNNNVFRQTNGRTSSGPGRENGHSADLRRLESSSVLLMNLIMREGMARQGETHVADPLWLHESPVRVYQSRRGSAGHPFMDII